MQPNDALEFHSLAKLFPPLVREGEGCLPRRQACPLQDSPLMIRTINTSFVERRNGTDRNRNARKVPKTYCFSKDWWTHRAATFFSKYSSNAGRPVRTLKADGGESRAPAMLAKLTDRM